MDVVFGRELTQRTGCAEYRLPVLLVQAADGRQQRDGPLRDQAGGRRCGKRSGGRLGEGFGGAYGGAADRFDGGRDPCRRKKIAAGGGLQRGVSK